MHNKNLKLWRISQSKQRNQNNEKLVRKITWNSRNWPLTKRKTRLDFPAPISPRRTWWKTESEGAINRNQKNRGNRKAWTHQFSIEIVVPDRSHVKRIGSIGREKRGPNQYEEIEDRNDQINPNREESLRFWILLLFAYGGFLRYLLYQNAIVLYAFTSSLSSFSFLLHSFFFTLYIYTFSYTYHLSQKLKT